MHLPIWLSTMPLFKIYTSKELDYRIFPRRVPSFTISMPVSILYFCLQFPLQSSNFYNQLEPQSGTKSLPQRLPWEVHMETIPMHWILKHSVSFKMQVYYAALLCSYLRFYPISPINIEVLWGQKLFSPSLSLPHH